MKVTVLMENTAPAGCGLSAEHGLSLFLEYRGHALLLDAGSSGRFADNALALGIDLEAVEAAVLSHGHYDHADGLRRFFACNRRARVYLRSGAEGAYYAMDPEGPRFIGMHRDIWREHRERFVPVQGLFPLMEGVWLAPCMEEDPAFAGRASNLMWKRGGDDFLPDDYRHEQSLVLEGARGLVVFNSCCHGGVVNIVRSVLEQLPGKRVYAVVGGLHMQGKGAAGMNCTPEYVGAVAEALRELGVEQLWTGHCTGGPALELLQDRFGAGCRALTTGQVLEL